MRIMLRTLCACVAVVPLVGCDRGNKQPADYNITLDEARVDSDMRLQDMIDNAMLQDMSVASIHFVPHTSMLNSLGEQRLRKYADLLMDRGGTLYYQATTLDEEVNDARMASISNFLAGTGIADDRITTEPGLSVGRGLAAVEAILVKERAFAPDQTGLTDLVSGSSGGFSVGG